MDWRIFLNDLGASFDQFGSKLSAFLPNLIGALIILVFGVIIARVVKVLSRKFLLKIGHLLPGKSLKSQLQPERLEKASQVISNILFWILVFFFITAATEILGLPVVTTWLSGIANYLPKTLVAVLIAVAGIIGSLVIRDLIVVAADSAKIAYGNILGSFARYVILAITLLIAVDQIGIDIQFLSTLVILVIAAMLLGAAMAFGMGAKDSVSNILSSYYLQKIYRAGQNVSVGEAEGRIIDITPTTVVLETTEGQLHVPSKIFFEKVSVLYKEEGQRGN